LLKGKKVSDWIEGRSDSQNCSDIFGERWKFSHLWSRLGIHKKFCDNLTIMH